MNITPPLGIGDLLLLKMKELSNDLTINQINVSYQLLTGYRKYPENYLPLIKNFIKLLFINDGIQIISFLSYLKLNLCFGIGKIKEFNSILLLKKIKYKVNFLI